ncbi:MAG: hypothetical protein IJH40_05560 [Ruminococcus sp.]|uniref:hypothetical protein n=1 Tax=Ruminococcus sp. TaxID=41978 RepID=UPI0028739088|nr:hypothetical protein [Ruminococcus sp.]MBQ3285090.1 hypothetical protein [Ruminococcus sp.]
MLNRNDWNTSENVMSAAKEATSDMRGMRVLRARRTERGWSLKYITLNGDDYPIAAIERSLTRMLGEAVNMVNLHYDFDTAARLICA